MTQQAQQTQATTSIVSPNRDHITKLIAVYNENIGKDISIPSARRGSDPIVVKCDRIALDIVVRELKLLANGKRTTLPDKDSTDFSRINNQMTTLKKSVRMFANLGVPTEYLPKFDRQPRSSHAIEDVDAYLASIS